MGLENLTGLMTAAVKLYRKTLRLMLDRLGDAQGPFAPLGRSSIQALGASKGIHQISVSNKLSGKSNAQISVVARQSYSGHSS
jgi:hypothetical protein